MKAVSLRAVVVLSALVVCHSGRAGLVAEFDLSGFGTNIPLDSYSVGIDRINTSISSGHYEGQTAQVHDFSLLRSMDGFSPGLANAVAVGFLFPSATVRFVKATSPSVPYISFDFQNLIADSYSLAGTWNGSIPAEHVSFTYQSVTIHYTAGSPGDKGNPWGAMVPPVWPSLRNADDTVDLAFLLSADGPQLPGGITPDFPFTPDQLRVTSPIDPNFLYTAEALDGTISPLGEVLPPTLPTPEPPTGLMGALGLVALAAWGWRRKV